MAAKERMIKATKHVTCLVCGQIFKNPKCLPCYHSYCEECLEEIQEESKIICPDRKCGYKTIIPKGGVKDLPYNFFIEHVVDEFILKRKAEGEEDVKCDNCDKDDPVVSYCPDCSLFLCHICNESHKRDKRSASHEQNIVPFAELKSNKNVPLQTKPTTVMCEKHNVELLFYCETCEELICMCCTTKEHSGHNHKAVKQSVGKYREELKKITTPVKDMNNRLSKACRNLDKMVEELHKFGDDVGQAIDHHYDAIIENLIKQKEDMKQQLQYTVAQKEKAIVVQIEELQCMQEEVIGMAELNDVIERGSGQEVLFAKEQIANQMQEVTDKYSTVNIDAVHSATMEFLPIHVPLPQFGQLFTHIDPAASEVTDVPPYAFVGQMIQLTVTTKYHFGYHCSKGGSQVSAQLEYDAGGILIAQHVKDNDDGSYVVSFVPKQAGRAKLFVSINGLHIREYPHSIVIHKSYSAVTMPNNVVDRNGKMGQPWGIAFSQDGMWAVTDWFKHRVYLFNKQNELILKFGSHGSNNGQLNFPYGISFDADNRLYIADGGNHRVQKFDVTGRFLLQFGSRGSGNGQLNSPCSVKIHNDKVYVADCYNHRISVYQKDTGEFCNFIGEGKLDAPYDLSVNTNDILLVVDRDQHCVSAFTLDGEFVSKFGSKGKGLGQLKDPCSLTTDIYDCVLVTDTGNNRISAFDKDGKCVGSFASQFNCPRGIAITQNGTIYISDTANKRVQIFSTF